MVKYPTAAQHKKICFSETTVDFIATKICRRTADSRTRHKADSDNCRRRYYLDCGTTEEQCKLCLIALARNTDICLFTFLECSCCLLSL